MVMKKRNTIIYFVSILLVYAVIDARHFNGGTIRWEPVNPTDTSNSVTITITQTYYWTSPVVKCLQNVPASSGFTAVSDMLICIVDCWTDGNYSMNPISSVTDCISSNPSLNLITSQRSVNVTLTKNAHFYAAVVGTAWRGLSYPIQNGLEWSIVTHIDIRKRSDDIINTPPVASVISPQYSIVNRTKQIKILVSDVNEGDDVRCRWSVYTPGYRRRRQINQDEEQQHISGIYKRLSKRKRNTHIVNTEEWLIKTGYRQRREAGVTTTTTTTTSRTTTTSTTTRTTTTNTTTPETAGTPKSTSSYPIRQALDECGGICHPATSPNDTTLSNCTISFTPTRAGVWYAFAIQVEDFIDTTSTTAMSSVPVQLLVYVAPEPKCLFVPIVLPYEGCSQVTAGVSTIFTLKIYHGCNYTISYVTDVIITSENTDIQSNNVTRSPTNSSLYYQTFTWTPQMNQLGSQDVCVTAYTNEYAESVEYCIQFFVIISTDICSTTTTSTTSTSTSTSTTSSTTTTVSTTTSSSTSSSSTTTSSTTASTSTSSSTSTKTSTTTSTSTSSSTSTTTSTTTSTSTSSSTSTTTSTTTSTSTSSSTSTTTSTTTFTTTTTTTSTTATTELKTTVAPEERGISWGLIAGICSVALPLALCCCCCLYWRFWSPSARRRRHEEEEEDEQQREQEEEDETIRRYRHFTATTEVMSRTTIFSSDQNASIEEPTNNDEVFKIFSNEKNLNVTGATQENEESILVRMYRNTNGRRANSVQPFNSNNSFELNNTSTRELLDASLSMTDKLNMSTFSSPSFNGWYTDSTNAME